MFLLVSVNLVEDIIRSDTALTKNDLGFILTVLRDNSSDDLVFNLLNLLLKNFDTKICF